MHIAIQGALVGLAIAIAMFVADYFLIRANAADRAKRKAKKTELDGTEKERIKTLLRYCFFVPLLFAGIFWLAWG